MKARDNEGQSSQLHVESQRLSQHSCREPLFEVEASSEKLWNSTLYNRQTRRRTSSINTISLCRLVKIFGCFHRTKAGMMMFPKDNYLQAVRVPTVCLPQSLSIRNWLLRSRIIELCGSERMSSELFYLASMHSYKCKVGFEFGWVLVSYGCCCSSNNCSLRPT